MISEFIGNISNKGDGISKSQEYYDLPVNMSTGSKVEIETTSGWEPGEVLQSVLLDSCFYIIARLNDGRTAICTSSRCIRLANG